MAVRAQFFVDHVVEKLASTNIYRSVVLRASTKGEANKEWSKWTPSGTIEMVITNETAVQWFKDHIGQDISIVFDEVSA